MSIGEQITVLVPTSPIPTHPSAGIICATIQSLRFQLPDAKVEITADGCVGDPPEAYQRYLDYIVGTMGATLYCGPHHQSGMLDHLRFVTTPFVLYLEHDWALEGDIPWGPMCDIIWSGTFNSIKLHANPRISPYYEHMMLERMIYQDGQYYDRYQDNRPGPAVGLIKTRQWSQNPHLALTQFYRDKILPMVSGKCDFVENVVHGIVANSPWEEFRTGILNPLEGDMYRVRHLDGKGSQI